VDIEQIFKSSVIGAKWTLGLSLAVMPLSYGTNIILGRTSPEALGIYGFLGVLMSVVATFFMFGGSQVIVKFLPELDSAKTRAFLSAYTALTFGVAATLLFIIILNPATLTYLTRREIDVRFLPYLCVLAPIVLIQHISLAALQARMQIKWMSIISKLTPVLYFFCFLALKLFFGGHFTQHGFLAIIAVVVGSNVISLFLAVYQVCTKVIGRVESFIQGFFPRGFWYFATVIHFSTIALFILDSFDQAFVVSRFDLSELGLYRAPLVTAQSVRWMPLILTQTMLPLFSNLLARREGQYIRFVYARLTRYGVLGTSAVALILILFSRQILGLFGEAYVATSSVLTILSGVFILSAVSTVNSSVIVATGRVGWGTVNGLIGSATQIFLSLMLVDRLGLNGIAVAKVSNLLCITALNALFVLWAFGLRPESKVIMVLAIDLVAILLAQWIVPPTLPLVVFRNLAILAGFSYLVWRLGVITRDDCRFLFSMLSVRTSP
jgi:O-antigen/teichoic acid export membrane protein